MRRITAWCLSAALLLGGLSGCGTARQSTAQTQAAVSWSDMQPTDSVDLEYAECFSVDHYDGGYSLITVKDDARYLVVPENASVPDGLDADIVVLQQPLDSIYLVSSSVMDQFVALDALDSIALSGTRQDNSEPHCTLRVGSPRAPVALRLTYDGVAGYEDAIGFYRRELNIHTISYDLLLRLCCCTEQQQKRSKCQCL